MGRSAVVFLTLLAVAGGCGDSSNGPGSGTYAAKCAVACTAPAEGPCAGQATAACQVGCEAATEGLSVLCAQCVAERTGWRGERCTCYGTGCCLVNFCSGGCGADACAPGDSCSADQESCGPMQGSPTDTDCAQYCDPSPDGGA